MCLEYHNLFEALLTRPNNDSVQNVFSAIVTILLCCSGPLTLLKAQGLLLMSLVVIVVNLINLVILEVGEWRGFLSVEDRKFIKENGMDDMMYNGRKKCHALKHLKLFLNVFTSYVL